MTDNRYFVDVFADVVAAVRAEYDTDNNEQPYYIYGHPLEIANRLSLKDRDSVDKFKKWPLIALITDFEEDYSDDVNISYSVSPTVLIVAPTKPTYTSEQRYEHIFKPILYPLYKSLIENIHYSKKILTKSNKVLDHTKIDRLFWGTSAENGNASLVFNTYNDAIEINFGSLEIVKGSQPCTGLSI